MSIETRLKEIKQALPDRVQVVAVSKFHPDVAIREAYDAGHRLFGESRVQELLPKYDALPKDIEWHFIGHLQTNKVKYIIPFIHTIQSVDSWKLLEEINKEAQKFHRTIEVLLQVHIANEEHKFGFTFDEIESIHRTESLGKLPHVKVTGLMGMASLTDDREQVRSEFRSLVSFYKQLQSTYYKGDESFRHLSCGMSDDYPIAVEEGSNMVRIGSKIFGLRE